MTKREKLEIRSLHTIEELEEVRKLESKIWGESDSIPSHQTLTAVKNGGLVLGAYYEGQLAGFQYSFPGFNGKDVYLCSHVLGTDKKFRNQGIGEKLKQAQRTEAVKLGYSLITWTYDPLETMNGYLNIGKLGGVCSTYIPNCYGEMDDLLNSGLASDRFLIEWHINKENSGDSSGQGLDESFALSNSLIQWVVNAEGLPIPTATLPLPGHECDITFVAVPKDFRKIRETNLDVASEWRMKTRDIFTSLVQQSWQVTGFKKITCDETPVHTYILTKR
ncbi:MAG: GNAT family N-acetyltransferase [Bacillus sp. (in: firmicutes)]|jgi:predicted GNAT superfamily acetyltransferase